MININMSLSELILIILVAAIVVLIFYYVFQDKARQQKEQKLRSQPKLVINEIIPNMEIIKTTDSPVVECRPDITLRIENIGYGRAMNIDIDGYAVFQVDTPNKSIASCFYFSNRPESGNNSLFNMSIPGDSESQLIHLYTHGYAVSNEAIDEGIRIRISYSDTFDKQRFTDVYDKENRKVNAPCLSTTYKKTLGNEVKCLIWPDSERIYLDTYSFSEDRNRI